MDEHDQTTSQDPLINLLFDDGLQSALPKIAEILMNAAMLLERETYIGAAAYQRGVERNGYANGFKPRTFQKAMGPWIWLFPRSVKVPPFSAPPCWTRAPAAASKRH